MITHLGILKILYYLHGDADQFNFHQAKKSLVHDDLGAAFPDDLQKSPGHVLARLTCLTRFVTVCTVASLPKSMLCCSDQYRTASQYYKSHYTEVAGVEVD